MNCYNHHSKSAIGICKNCNKGLCEDCLTEIDNGIACTSTCVEETTQINSLINRNKKIHNSSSSAYLKSTYLYLAFSCVFIYFGFTTQGMDSLITIMGLLFLVAAIFNAINAKKYKNQD